MKYTFLLLSLALLNTANEAAVVEPLMMGTPTPLCRPNDETGSLPGVVQPLQYGAISKLFSLPHIARCTFSFIPSETLPAAQHTITLAYDITKKETASPKSPLRLKTTSLSAHKNVCTLLSHRENTTILFIHPSPRFSFVADISFFPLKKGINEARVKIFVPKALSSYTAIEKFLRGYINIRKPLSKKTKIPFCGLAVAAASFAHSYNTNQRLRSRTRALLSATRRAITSMPRKIAEHITQPPPPLEPQNTEHPPQNEQEDAPRITISSVRSISKRAPLPSSSKSYDGDEIESLEWNIKAAFEHAGIHEQIMLLTDLTKDGGPLTPDRIAYWLKQDSILVVSGTDFAREDVQKALLSPLALPRVNGRLWIVAPPAITEAQHMGSDLQAFPATDTSKDFAFGPFFLVDGTGQKHLLGFIDGQCEEWVREYLNADTAEFSKRFAAHNEVFNLFIP